MRTSMNAEKKKRRDGKCPIGVELRPGRIYAFTHIPIYAFLFFVAHPEASGW
jgi:hypothetical protein